MDETTLNILKILPLAGLIVLAFVLVLRGLGRKADDTNNQAKGGGPGDGSGAGGPD